MSLMSNPNEVNVAGRQVNVQPLIDKFGNSPHSNRQEIRAWIERNMRRFPDLGKVVVEAQDKEENIEHGYNILETVADELLDAVIDKGLMSLGN